MAEDSKLGAEGSKTLASEGNASGDMFEGLVSKRGGPTSGPVSARSAPPPPPTSERLPLPEAKRTLLGIPSPTAPVSAPPPSLPGARSTLPNVAPPPPRSPVPPAPGTQPANGAASPGKGLEMDWDDENEATHVFDKESQGPQLAASPVSGSSPPPAAKSEIAPATMPTTARGTPPPPPPASASMRAAAKAISQPPALGATVSQAVGPITSAQSERALGSATPPPPPGSAAPVSRRSAPPPPPSAAAAGPTSRRSTPPPPPAGSGAPPSLKASAPPSLPPQPTHAPLVTTLASADGAPPQPAANVQVTTTPMAMPARPEPVKQPLEATALVHPPAANRSWLGLGLGLAGAAVGAFALVLWLNSRGGTVTISALDAKGSGLDHVSIYVDGQKTKCETSPCPLEITSGSHTVKVMADGLDTPEAKTITVEAGKNTPVEFKFTGHASSTSVASGTSANTGGGTGFKVASAGTGLKLYVDGQERGALPQEIKDLAPGEHKIRIGGNDRYQPLEKTVTVNPGTVLDLGTVTPKVLRGRATIEVVTPGAKLSLQAPGEAARQITVPVPPLDLDTSKGWTLHASKTGFDDLVLPLAFADGEAAEKTFSVSLLPKGSASKPPATNNTAVTGSTISSSSSTTSSSSSSAASEPKGEATLTINSIPASKVVIDGSPAGETPVANKTVSAGTHRIMLVNSDQDLKKTVTLKLKAGETKKLIVNLRE